MLLTLTMWDKNHFCSQRIHNKNYYSERVLSNARLFKTTLTSGWPLGLMTPGFWITLLRPWFHSLLSSFPQLWFRPKCNSLLHLSCRSSWSWPSTTTLTLPKCWRARCGGKPYFYTMFSLAGCLYVMSLSGFPLSARSTRVSVISLLCFFKETKVIASEQTVKTSAGSYK